MLRIGRKKQVMALLFVLALGWLSFSHSTTVATRGFVVLAKLEEALASAIGPTWRLRMQAQQTMAAMTQEVDRLLWIEATAWIRAETAAARIEALQIEIQHHYEGVRRWENLLALSARRYKTPEGWLTASELATYIEQIHAEAPELAAEMEVYVRIWATYTDSAQQARELRRQVIEAQRQLAAQMAFLEATSVLGQVSGDHDSLTAMIESVQQQIEFNRRTIEILTSLDSQNVWE